MPNSMKRWLTKLQASRSQRQLRLFAKWELTRAKGRPRFVLRCALMYPLLMIPAVDFANYLFDGKLQPWSEKFWINAGSYFITGVFMGYVSWASMEGKYKSALLERRIAAAEINPSRPFEP